jgi:hypothetical protein
VFFLFISRHTSDECPPKSNLILRERGKSVALATVQHGAILRLRLNSLGGGGISHADLERDS